MVHGGGKRRLVIAYKEAPGMCSRPGLPLPRTPRGLEMGARASQLNPQDPWQFQKSPGFWPGLRPRKTPAHLLVKGEIITFGGAEKERRPEREQGGHAAFKAA